MLPTDAMNIQRKLVELLANKIQIWNDIFNNLNIPEKDNDQPISERQFKNPYSYTVISTFYLYSLDEYLYRRLNWAARTKQAKCVKNMGCFATVLSQCLIHANTYCEK